MKRRCAAEVEQNVVQIKSREWGDAAEVEAEGSNELLTP